MDTRDRLVIHLKEAKGAWVSGQALSRRLDVTRAAVWKHICRLREEGYVIDSSTRKGYFFRDAADSLLPGEIRRSLQTRCLGHRIVYYPEVDSTNRVAKELAMAGEPEGTLILSDRQTGGRGRKGRAWFSPPGGGIYLSLILRPGLHPVEAPKMTLLAGVALAETLLPFIASGVSIRWPNDLYSRGKKIAGILMEVAAEIDTVDYLVLGVGLNVNIPGETFPTELRGRATSLVSETGSPARRAELLSDFLSRLEERYLGIGKTGFSPVIQRWRELTDTIGKRVRATWPDHPVEGIVAGIGEDGRLLLKCPDGSVRQILSGELEYLDHAASGKTFDHRRTGGRRGHSGAPRE
jgi:BirA family transcriptional regulator, biotin operon repressor / biotin---[acetyl-CoA-carboxylase] ligase